MMILKQELIGPDLAVRYRSKSPRDNRFSIRRTPRPGDKRHLDGAGVTINGERHVPWCAVYQDGFVLEVLVQKRRVPGPPAV
jgi:transposase-like protein